MLLRGGARLLMAALLRLFVSVAFHLKTPPPSSEPTPRTRAVGTRGGVFGPPAAAASVALLSWLGMCGCHGDTGACSPQAAAVRMLCSSCAADRGAQSNSASFTMPLRRRMLLGFRLPCAAGLNTPRPASWRNATAWSCWRHSCTKKPDLKQVCGRLHAEAARAKGVLSLTSPSAASAEGAFFKRLAAWRSPAAMRTKLLRLPSHLCSTTKREFGGTLHHAETSSSVN